MGRSCAYYENIVVPTDGLNSDTLMEPGKANTLFLFVDTNFFLQLRQPEELPWNEIWRGSNLILVVPRPVQKELSRLKAGGNSRRSRRARNAAGRLMHIAHSPDGMHVVGESGPKVELRLASRGATLSLTHPDLDANNTDDQIIAEILGFRTAHPDDQVALLTTDSDQVMSCKHFGIRFIAVPEDWHLPPEPDERDKRIQELERRVVQIEAAEPKITIFWRNAGGDLVDVLTIEANDYPPLPPELLDELVAEAKRRSPPAEGLDELVSAKHPPDAIDRALLVADRSARFRPPKPEEISDYREQHYPAWLDRLRKFFAVLPEQTGYASRLGRLTPALRNEGARPAQGTIVTFTALGGIRLIREGHGARGDEKRFPAPPKPPKGALVSRGSFLAGPPYDPTLPRMPRFDPHDPHAFYFTQGDRAKPSDQWVFTCDQFRHGACEETFEIPILVPYGAKPVNSAIRCYVFARNMSAPVEATIPIKVVFHPADSIRAARELLDRHLPPEPQVCVVSPDN